MGFETTINGNSSGHDRSLYMDTSGKLHFGIWTNALYLVSSTNAYNDGNWHHVAATVSTNTGMCLYVDGLPVASNSIAAIAQNYAGYWRIGETTISGWTYAPANMYFGGSLDEVSLYSRPLSAAEVQAIYLAGSGGKCFFWPIPNTPSNLIAQAISPTQISLTWNDVPNWNDTQIIIERSTSSSGPFTDVADVSALTYIDTNVAAGTTYYYQVQAINGSTLSPPSNLAEATTPTTGASMPLGNLVMWLKADSGLTLGTTNEPVGFWGDQSGNGNNATQSTPGNQPTWVANGIGSLPVIQFSGTNYFGLGNFLGGTTGAEAVVVLKVAADPPATPCSLWNMSDPAYEGYPNANGSISESFGVGNAWNYNFVPTLPLTQYHVYEVSSQNNIWQAWINEILQDQVFNNPYGCYAAQLGAFLYGGTSQYFQGDIAEVMIFNRPLTTSERTTANIYLTGKYGLVPAVPPTPTNLLALAISPTQIELTWSEPLTNGGITQIAIERSTNNNGPFTTVAQVSDALSYVDTNLAAGTTYYYEAQSVNLTTWSPSSNVAQATTFTNGATLPLSSLIFWVKADSGLTQFSNAPVNIWIDQSGRGNNAGQGTGTNRPIWVPGALNGLPVVQFSGTNFFLSGKFS